jgi:hypothetical protein
MLENAEIAKRLIDECQTTMAHAWMIRAFLRHSDEAEDSPEMFDFGRSVFDLCRALEPFLEDPALFFKTLRKKIRAFEVAVEKFAVDAPKLSYHTNYLQAVESAKGCVANLNRIMEEAIQAGLILTAVPKQE